jgi:Uncharacterised protein family (UPF0149)
LVRALRANRRPSIVLCGDIGDGARMSSSPSDIDDQGPLSDREFDELAELCEEHSPFDIDGLLGLLHAVGVGPGSLGPGVWLPVAFPDLEPGAEESARCTEYAQRLYNEVIDDLAEGQHQIPPPEEVEQCEAFAAGYTAGVELNPQWVENEEAWVLARDIAYLADRQDLLEASDIAEIEAELAPDPKLAIRQELSGIVGTALEIFQSTGENPAPRVKPHKSH